MALISPILSVFVRGAWPGPVHAKLHARSRGSCVSIISHWKRKFPLSSKLKFKSAIKAIYNTDCEDKIFAPGLHNTLETIASFCEDGLERFMKEVDEMAVKYPSIKHQIIKSLELYIDDVTQHTNPEMKKLIIPILPYELSRAIKKMAANIK